MSFFKRKPLPHMATPTELKEVHKRLDAEMQGLTQEWALEALDIDRLLPLIFIADNERLGTTKAVLYAYRYGFLDGRGVQRYLHRKGKTN